MTYGMPDATQILFAAQVLQASPQRPERSTRAELNTNLIGPITHYAVNGCGQDARNDRAGNAVYWRQAHRP
jgi:hypothetical protein